MGHEWHQEVENDQHRFSGGDLKSTESRYRPIPHASASSKTGLLADEFSTSTEHINIRAAQPGDRIESSRRGGCESDRLNAIFAEVYDELRGIAHGMLRSAPPNRTLQPTALVHEAYLRLCQTYKSQGMERRHFFGAAAESMRRILVEDARRRMTLRRGGHLARVPLDQVQVAADATPELLIGIDEALKKLAVAHPLEAQVVQLIFYGGLTAVETGEVLNVCDRTIKRHWAFARAWLFKELAETT